MDQTELMRLSKSDLLQIISKQEIRIRGLVSEVDSFQRMSSENETLKRRYLEQKSTLLNVLWIHCTQHHPELSNIPSIEYESNFVESANRVGCYDLADILGEGTFAVVRVCRTNFGTGAGKQLAAKIIHKETIKSFTTLRRLSDEIGVLRRLCSSEVTNLQQVIHTRNYLYIITDRGGRDLFEFFNTFPGKIQDDLVRAIVVGILKGVSYIHDLGICHRDLKPENVLISFGNSDKHYDSLQPGLPVQIKLCDFGLSIKFKRKMMLLDFCGSPGFFAPEMVTQGCYYGDKADIWSIGCILLEFILGHKEFCLNWMWAYSYDIIEEDETFGKNIAEVVNCVYDKMFAKPSNSDFASFISMFLRLKASERVSLRKIGNHPWLKNQFTPKEVPTLSIEEPEDMEEPMDFPTSLGKAYNSAANSAVDLHAAPQLDKINLLLSELNNVAIQSLESSTPRQAPNPDFVNFRMPPMDSPSPRQLLGATDNLGSNSNPIFHSGRKLSYASNESKSHMRVLIVEDSLPQRKLMTRRLEAVSQLQNGGASWDIVQAPDAETAMSEIQSSPKKFDIIFVDENLTDDPNKMNGHDLVQQLRSKFKNYSDSVIIGCTGNASKHSPTLLSAGADAVLSKPLPNETDLLLSITSLVKTRRPQITSENLYPRPPKY